MSKILQKPLACRNAHCGAMCFPLQAEEMERIWDGKPSKCPFYERRNDLYQNTELLDKVKKAREEIKNIKKLDFLDTVGLLSSNNDEFETSKKFAIAILDKLTAEEEEEE